ncbi:hypothetical protein IU457_27950 [Nocardia cyriacigeorgica]|nr:hypothetical protein [Nocardia cyriacigeorgica]
MYGVLAGEVVASAAISSWWIGSVHATWDIPAPLLYLEPVVIHVAVLLGVWKYSRLTEPERRRGGRRLVSVLIALVGVVAALATWERLGHFDLIVGLVMATICSVGPILLILFLLPDHADMAILAPGRHRFRGPAHVDKEASHIASAESRGGYGAVPGSEG